MSGLILAGIGKGIADAGAAYGGGMMKGAEFEMQNQRDEAREQRSLRMASELETQKENKAAAKSTEISNLADMAPAKRAALEAISKLKEIAPNPDEVMSEQDMTAYLKQNPSYKQGLEKSGLIGEDKMDPRLRRAVDEEKAAREVGTSASMLESYRKQKSDTLALIAQENKEARADTRDEQMNRRLDIMEKGAVARQSAADAKAKNAGVDKPITGVDLERTAKAAERALSMQLGVPVKDVPETVARLKKQNKIDSDTQSYLDEYNAALKEWQGYKRKPKDSADNATPAAPTIPDLPKGAVQIGTSGGKPVYQTPDGKKFIGK